MSGSPAPIIIKRKKVIAGGHHGGAWKVAYADFVTAMMAFFLLMWLLGATNEKQRKGIADYFNPTIPINRVSGGGDGAFGGDSIFSQDTLARSGTGAGVTVQSASNAAKGDNGIEPSDDQKGAASSQETDDLQDIADKLSGRAGESMVSDLLQRHVIARLTDEGLIVEVFDIPGAPLFEGDAEPTDEMEAVAAVVTEVFRLASNDIAVQGHTAAVPMAARENPVWELSSSRADAVRELLVADGLPPGRMQRVTGFADRKPVSADLLSIRNNRIEIILLRRKL
ncbi:chemotaxis protein MotB [Silicimonas algicola]|uniref:Chemotaxis protein MotB n=1 Tax=Silicimonas algicola TaxID=1826607 RepID=A0A316GA68_9RHOB|nr:flagellar motor protein MotB [Silicimonas algicola]AZQ69507.1 chemotaxis protein MotB [Silicimonas algicola]PWK56580.1 chemotaxis protein MotB [Silicimonas algicola]